MTDGRLVIIAATAREAAAVRRIVRVRRRGWSREYGYGPTAVQSYHRWWEGEAAGCPVMLLRSGIGPRWAADAAEAARRLSPRGIVVLGFAGALRLDLRPGTLIVADGTRSKGDDGPDVASVVADPALVRAAEQAGEAAGIRTARGMLVTVPRLVETPEAKAALAAATGAAAVDMEAGAVATVAARAGVPFFAAKIIFDAAHERLHPCLLEALHPDGSHRYLYAAYLAARDQEVRAALHWAARQSRAAARALTAFCRAFFPLAGTAE